jgi:tetratricopeptide (TPR) repeat protein
MPNPATHRFYIICLCLSVVAAFVSGIDGVFVLDDTHQIISNVSIRSLWPPWAPLVGTTRPLVQALNAVNYAISGLEPWSYHIVNIALHLGAALTLFGVALRTLKRLSMTAENAAGLAAAGATIWAVHPLQTESVTYIIQRAEVAMGFAIFLMIYCFLRATESQRPACWLTGSVAACLAGYTAKPIMVIAPLLLWLFDRQFVSGTFCGAWRGHPKFYLAIFLSPLVVPLLLAADPSEWKDSAGVGSLPVTWYEYAATQPEIILHYLRLVAWPKPLCLDYGWPIERSALVIAVSSLAIIAAIAMTLWGLVRKRPWSFLGAWFFVNLAPTSSVIPIADLAFEHRMYLALAAISFGMVTGVYLALRDRHPKWLTPALATGAVIVFGTLTVMRNREYSSAIRLWAGNVAARPDYARPRNNLGLELARTGQLDAAISQLQRAIALKPGYVTAHYNLGKTLLEAGKPAEARQQLETALGLAPDDPRTHTELGRTFQKFGDHKSAAAHFANAARLNQGDANAWLAFASSLLDNRRYADVARVLDQALRPHSDSPELMRALSVILAAAPDEQVRNPARALELARRTVEMTRRSDSACLDTLGMAQAANGDFDSAIKTTEQAIVRAREQNSPPDVISPMEARILRYRERQAWRLDVSGK